MGLTAVIHWGAEAKLTHEKLFPRSEMFCCLRNIIFSRVLTVFRSIIMVIQSTGTTIRHEFRLEIKWKSSVDLATENSFASSGFSFALSKCDNTIFSYVALATENFSANFE